MGDRDRESRRGGPEDPSAGRFWNPAARLRTQGFTLIELVVVIAIVVVLMAILFPILNRAREAGRRAVCMGHMHQIQIAWHAYAVDHGDRIVNGQPLPFSDDAVNRNDDGRPWLSQVGVASSPGAAVGEAVMRTGALAPYVGNVRTYLCPSRYRNAKDPHTTGYGEWASSYSIQGAMNCRNSRQAQVCESRFRGKYSVGRTVLHVKKTSDMVDPGPASRAVFMDCGIGWRYWCDDLGVWGLGQATNILYGGWQPIHHGKGTFLSFADGHEEYWRWSQPDAIAWQQWSIDQWLYGSEAPRPPVPKPDGPDYVRLFTAVWGRWPVSLNSSGVK